MRAEKAVRTSATENWASVDKPAVNGSTVSATLAGRSITTFVLDQRGHATTAVRGALKGAQSGKCLTAGASGAAIDTCTGGTEQSWSYDADGTLKGANGYLTAGSSGLTAAADHTGDATQRWLLNASGSPATSSGATSPSRSTTSPSTSAARSSTPRSSRY
ncbi:ricin-type beta-trefoil lectin domain protein [Streptomyces sp. NPDC051104]|uniref:ricin-type beta-trefoil lectin domain protein n=1 Tax=Streptomyces sp. NPDC051104 TaxID=3155044 RepID=UPI00341FFF25